MLEPLTDRVFVFSHQSPSITVIDPKEGSVVGRWMSVARWSRRKVTERENCMWMSRTRRKIAVCGRQNSKVITKYDLGEGAGEPAGLGLDVKNHLLFAMCANPGVCIVLNADDGKVLAKLPLRRWARTAAGSIPKRWKHGAHSVTVR